MNKTILPLLASAIAAGSVPAQWTTLSPAVSPPARGAAGMACDPFSNTLLLFGGVGGTGTGTLFADTWTYDGANWTQLSPATSPPAKFYMDIVFDSVRGVYVMYGGNATFTAPGTNQTWEFDGTDWAQKFPANNPGNLGLHAMAFDSVRNKVVLYGGMPGGNPIVDSNQTWEYDGINWTRRFPATNPGQREACSMCFHAGIGKTILFGGVNATSGAPFPVDNDKTWAWDGTNWTELTITGTRPPARERARLAYDSLREVCVLVGGMHYSNGQTRNDTWELANNGVTWKWTQVVTPNLPATFYRFNSTLAFMFGNRSMVQFGGVRGSATYFGDTAEYLNYADTSVIGVGCPGTSGVPVLSAVDAPRLGASFTLNITNMNPTYNVGFMVIGFTPLLPLDLGPLLGMPGCFGHTTPDIVELVSGAAGAASWSWSPVNGAPGATFYCQALPYDPTVNSFGFTATNAVSATLGN